MNFRRFGVHLQPRRLVLTFSEALDRVRASDFANYRLVGPHGGIVPIGSASYVAATRSVTLLPRRLVSLWHTFRLTVNGTSTGRLTNLVGNALDGDGDGHPGGDFVGRVDRSLLAAAPHDRAIRPTVSPRTVPGGPAQLKLAWLANRTRVR